MHDTESSMFKNFRWLKILCTVPPLACYLRIVASSRWKFAAARTCRVVAWDRHSGCSWYCPCSATKSRSYSTNPCARPTPAAFAVDCLRDWRKEYTKNSVSEKPHIFCFRRSRPEDVEYYLSNRMGIICYHCVLNFILDFGHKFWYKALCYSTRAHRGSHHVQNPQICCRGAQNDRCFVLHNHKARPISNYESKGKSLNPNY